MPTADNTTPNQLKDSSSSTPEASEPVGSSKVEPPSFPRVGTQVIQADYPDDFVPPSASLDPDPRVEAGAEALINWRVPGITGGNPLGLLKYADRARAAVVVILAAADSAARAEDQIERVSRALCEIDGRSWDDLYDESKANYRGLAPRLVAAVLGDVA